MAEDQAHYWSQVSASYEKEFVDPYRPAVRSPLLRRLRAIRGARLKTIADLGCGIGPLLPFLSDHYQHVYAIDFAPGMLERARQSCSGRPNIEFVERSLTDLGMLAGKIDVAVAVNSLVMQDLGELGKALEQIRCILKPNGRFHGIVPAMDGVHYYTMLLMDRALDAGKPMAVARKNAAHHNDHKLYDFAFSEFRFQGLEQHFWQPFEIRYRLRRAGFRDAKLARVWLDWKQFAWSRDLQRNPPPWDWYFEARVES